MARLPSAKTETIRLGGVLDFMRLLWAVNHELESMSKAMDRTFGVTGPQRLVLRIVGRFPGIGAGRLAAILRVDPSTLTGVLWRLVQRGLVVRERDPADGRRVVLSLTPRGRAIDALRDGTVEASIHRVLRRYPPRELEAAQHLLEAVATTLEAEVARRTR